MSSSLDSKIGGKRNADLNIPEVPIVVPEELGWKDLCIPLEMRTEEFQPAVFSRKTFVVMKKAEHYPA